MAIYPCHPKRAQRPFVMDYTGQRIFTLEELSYFMTNHLTLLGEDVINEALCVWLRDELGLVQLSSKLMAVLEEYEHLEDFVYLIVREAGFTDIEEWKQIRERLAALNTLDEWQKEKLRADDILRLNRFQRAASSYRKLLRRTDRQSAVTEADLAKVYHNLAVTRLYTFEYEAATENFLQAYQLGQRIEYLIKGLFVMRMMVSEGRYQAYIHENIVPSDVRHMLDEKKDHFLIVSEQEAQEKADNLMKRRERNRIHDMIQGWKQAYLAQK